MVRFYLSFTVVLIEVLMCVTASYDSACENGKKCVSKCCPDESYVYNNKCASNTTLNKDFTDFYVYDNNLTRTKTLSDTFDIINGEFINMIPKSIENRSRFYLLEDGNLYIEIIDPNTPAKYTAKNDHFCIDYKQEGDGIFTPVYGVKWEETPTIKKDPSFEIAAHIISDIFLLLVLVVYLLLKELRNLKGKILMAMVFSLFGSFTMLVISKIIMSLNNYSISKNECIGYSSALYCFMLSAFFWMNVMSFDIWWTLRKMTNRVTIRGNRNNRKFLIYCAYAWGLPIAMTIALVLMENADLRHMHIITPNIVLNGCFLEGTERLLYLYTPMLILILCNCMFFLMTAYNIWLIGKDSRMLNTDATRKQNNQKQRFLIYLKLSLVMGISWVLDFLSSFYSGFLLWYITDAYNMFIGVAIFFIFVCKKKIFIKLSKRFQRKETNDNTESHPMSDSQITSRNYPL